jgi:hypothetical protein
MICPRCHGKGRLVGEALFWQGGKNFAACPEITPCPDCGATGCIHCCDGEQAQPDREEAMLKAARQDTMPSECNPNGEDYQGA